MSCRYTLDIRQRLKKYLITIPQQYLHFLNSFLFLPFCLFIALQSCDFEASSPSSKVESYSLDDMLEMRLNKDWHLANEKKEMGENKECIALCNRIDSLARLNPKKFANCLIGANALAAASAGMNYKQWDYFLKRGEQALEEYETYLSWEFILKSKVRLNYERCRYLDAQGDVDKANECYNQVWLDLPETHSDKLLVAYRTAIPISMAEVFWDIGDYKKAQTWLGIAEKNLDWNHEFYPGIYFNLKGKLNHRLNDWEQAKTDYQASRTVFVKGNAINGYHYIKNMIDLSSLFLEQNGIKESLQLLEELKENTEFSKIGILLIHHQLAKIYLTIGEPAKALRYGKKALAKSEKIHKGSYYWKGRVEHTLGSALVQQDKWEAALDTIQASLHHLSKEFTQRDWKYNPDLRSSMNKLDLLNNLSLKGELLQQYAKVCEEPYLLELSLSTYQKCIGLIKILRVEYGDDKVKEYLSEKSFPVFENALAAANQLYDIHGTARYVEAAFAISETSKALSLLENLKDIEAKKIANLPDSLIQKEQQLKRQIASLELKISDQIEGEQKIAQNQILTKAQGNYDALLERFKKEYKSYYELKYDVTSISIKQVQASLDQEETFIEYFFGDHHLYTFVITNDSKKIHTLPISEELIARIDAFRKSISTRTSLNSTTKIKKFQEISYQLYQDLLEPLTIEKNTLQIIPDGPLHGIPFAALIVDTFAVKEAYELPFLIVDKTIQYNFSASVQFQHQQKAPIQEAEKKVLVIAPASFPNDSRLSLNATTVAKRFGNQFHIKTDPSKSEVLALLAEGYETVLFFTHAAADEFPYIQLYKDTLYLKEIYAAPVATNVIFLSACETGVGENQKGEGVLSTGRGFAYQGVPNTIMTLWKVQDAPTMEIALDFIKYSKIEQLATAAALRQAQLNYLLEPGQGSPYFWAGFVNMGSGEL